MHGLNNSWIKKISGNRNFHWAHLDPVGRSGGILLGVDGDLHDIISSEKGDHYVSMLVKDSKTLMEWQVIVFYGPAQADDKDSFLVEFADKCKRSKGSVVMGGDFNIIGKTCEKNKPCVLPRWSHIFNSIIDMYGLKEVQLLGRLYTWANNLDPPTFEKLDRVLISIDWGIAYPLATVTGLNRKISDHVPLQLHLGVPPPHSNLFRFELCWLEREGFGEMVKDSWEAPTYCKFDLDKWQEKTRRFRRHAKGWHINVEGVYRNEKKKILSILDDLDKKSESGVLSQGEKESKCILEVNLKKLLRDEELKWRQRASEKDLLEGDGNTKYFQLKASGRKKKKSYHCLDERQ